MMANKFVFNTSLTLILLLQSKVHAICQHGIDISPCLCVNNTEISCTSIQHYKLKTVFQVLNKKLTSNQSHVFDWLHVGNYTDDNIPEDVFGSVSFKNIEFADSKITNIHLNAFTSSNQLTQKISFRNTSIDNRNEREFFDIISKFTHLQTLYITENKKLTAVPEHAFRPLIGTQKSLKWISLSHNDIAHIGDNAFYDLPSIEDLILSDNKISQISDFTFAFANTSTHFLNLDLRNNLLDSTSFEKNWYSRSLRPINLHLGANRMTYLSESIFSAFLNRNPNNTISLEMNPIQCDCKSKWLVGDKNFYKNKVFGMTCQDKKNIFDYTIDNFDHCLN